MSFSIEGGGILKGNSQSVVFQRICCSALRCCPECTAQLCWHGTGLCRARREKPCRALVTLRMQAGKVTASTPVSLTAVLCLFNPSFSAARTCPRSWGLDIQVEKLGCGHHWAAICSSPLCEALNASTAESSGTGQENRCSGPTSGESALPTALSQLMLACKVLSQLLFLERVPR